MFTRTTQLPNEDLLLLLFFFYGGWQTNLTMHYRHRLGWSV